MLWAISTAKLINKISYICGLTRFVNLSRNRTWRRWILLRRMWDGNTKCSWKQYLQLGPAELPRSPGKWNILRTQVRGVINRILNVAENKILSWRIIGKVSVDVRFFYHAWLNGVAKLQVEPYLQKKIQLREKCTRTEIRKRHFSYLRTLFFPKLLCSQT